MKARYERQECCYIPKRYIVTAFGFMGVVNMYAMRTSLSVTIVAMAGGTPDSFYNSTNLSVECPDLLRKPQEIEVQKSTGKHYDWSVQEQGIILGAFYYGYVLTQLPGGYLAEKIGAKWIFGGGILNTAIFTLLSPLIISWNVNAFIAIRLIEGVGEGMTLPAMNLMLSHWSPKTERSRHSSIVFSGISMGSMIAMLIAGWMSSSVLLGGWPCVYYLFGAISCVWFILWTFIVYESPSEHPTISIEELQCIQENHDESPEKHPETPWNAIFSSLPIWAAAAAHVGHNVGLMIFLADLPTYLSTILHFDIKDNGLLSALPFICQAIFSYLSSYIADSMRKSSIFSITNIRKIFCGVGLFGPAICLLVITISGCRPYLIIFLITLGMALNGCVYSGHNVIHVDMSPTFAGTTYAITNTAANLCGFIGPAIVGAFTDSGETISNWNHVFYTIIGSYTVSAAFFIAFASAEPQPWNKGKEETLSERKIG